MGKDLKESQLTHEKKSSNIEIYIKKVLKKYKGILGIPIEQNN